MSESEATEPFVIHHNVPTTARQSISSDSSQVRVRQIANTVVSIMASTLLLSRSVTGIIYSSVHLIGNQKANFQLFRLNSFFAKR